jgi:hypothetical protein
VSHYPLFSFRLLDLDPVVKNMSLKQTGIRLSGASKHHSIQWPAELIRPNWYGPVEKRHVAKPSFKIDLNRIQKGRSL